MTGAIAATSALIATLEIKVSLAFTWAWVRASRERIRKIVADALLLVANYSEGTRSAIRPPNNHIV